MKKNILLSLVATFVMFSCFARYNMRQNAVEDTVTRIGEEFLPRIAEIDEFPAREKTEEHRKLVYTFQHRLLPLLSSQGHLWFFLYLDSKKKDFLKAIWLYMTTVEKAQMNPGDFEVKSVEIEEPNIVHTIHFITFPEPQEMVENFYGAIVVSQPPLDKEDARSPQRLLQSMDENARKAKVRYFTLERTSVVEDEGSDKDSGMFCEWQGATHINYGRQAVSKKSFRDAVVEKIQE